MRIFRQIVARSQIFMATRVGISGGLFIVGCAAFSALAKEVRDNETLGWDNSILLRVHGQHSDTLNGIIVFITNAGGPYSVATVAVILGFWFWRRKRNDRASLLVTAVGGGLLLNVGLKLLFARARPELWDRIVHEPTFSFPSTHAMMSAAIATILVLIVWDSRWRIAALVAGVSYVAIIGYTRLYLGVHYPTDIIAGWIVAVGWSLFVYAIFWLRKRGGGAAHSSSRGARKEL